VLRSRNQKVARWVNRRIRHFAANDYHGQRRLMHRITVAGTPLD
jgi:taurine dioxygenase